MLRIVTDGAADMPPAWEKEFDIHVIPVNIRFGEKSYLQYAELDHAGFYRMVDETKTIPKTAQPSPHQFVEFYEKIAQPARPLLKTTGAEFHQCQQADSRVEQGKGQRLEFEMLA